MTVVLDAVYSSGILMFIAVVILTALFIIVGIKSPLNRLKIPRIVIIFYISLPVLFFLILFQFPLGFGFLIHDMLISGNRLVFYDDRANRRLPRLHVIDADTGELIYRTHFTKPPLFYRTHLEQRPELYSMRGDKLLMRKGPEFVIYDIQLRKEVVTYSYSNLANNYNDLSGGVESVIYDKDGSTLNVLSKNGKKYYIEPYSGIIHSAPVRENPLSRYEVYTLDSVIKKNNRTLVYFDNKKNSNLKVLKYGDSDNKYSGIYEFIDPDFMLLYPGDGVFIVRSYEKGDKQNFILTAFNLKLDKLWQVRRSELKTDNLLTFMLKCENKIYPRIQYGSNMIFAVGGCVFSVNIKTGAVNWTKRF